MSREILVALTTTIESREWTRRKHSSGSLPPEHPRASTPDDVECFLVSSETIGSHFTSKAVLFEW